MSWFQEKLLKLISKEKIEEVLSQYGQFKVKNFEPLSGWQNLGLKITTDSDTLILRIQRSKNLKRLKLILDVIEYLSELGFPVQKILKTKNGQNITQFKIGEFLHPAVVLSYLGGETKVILSNDEIIQVGSLMGKLHQNLATFETEENTRKLNLNQIVKKVEKDYPAKLKNEAEIFQIWQEFWPEIKSKLAKNLRILQNKQFIHGDLAPSNIIFYNSKISGILDFDGVIFAPKIWDLGQFIGNYTQTVKSWGREEQISQTLKNLVLGYEKTSSLTIEEKQILPNLLRLWFFEKIIWSKSQAKFKNREQWAQDIISWCLSGLLEKF